MFALLFLFSCKREEHLPTYSHSAFGHLDSIMGLSILEIMPSGEIIELEEGWQFHGWDTNSGRESKIPDFSSIVPIKLPHRIANPNSNIWYSNSLDFDDGYLWINADDGAQLWLNGIQVFQNADSFFPITKGLEGSINIQIRVINNAASGGLKKVFWIEQKDYENSMIQKTKSIDLVLQKAKNDLWIGESFPNNWKKYPIWYYDPVIIPVNKDSLLVRWSGEKNAKAKLHFGHEPKMVLNKQEVQETDGVYSAYVPCKKCQYFYFEMDNTVSPLFNVANNSNPKSSVFTVWADSQGGWDVFREVIHTMKIHQPEFTVGIGDLVGNGRSEWQYIQLKNELHQLPVPHYLFAGNHDYDGSYNNWIPENFNKYLEGNSQNNYRFWRSEFCAFIGLDPNENFPVEIQKGSEQYEWFLKTITSESWKKAPWKIVFVHQPPFSQGWKGYQGEKRIQDLLRPFWESGQIDLVISGHTHDYERLILEHQSGKTAFLIVGGAGGNLEPDDELENSPKMDLVIRAHHFGLIKANSQILEFSAIDVNGNQIDSFMLRK